ncbi:hypothetical protein LCGC14_1723610, partial [marine sediment metagenome]
MMRVKPGHGGDGAAAAAIAWVPIVAADFVSTTEFKDPSGIVTNPLVIHASNGDITFDTTEKGNETNELKVSDISSRRINGVPVKVVKLATKKKTDKVWQTMVVAEGGVTLEMVFG